MLKPRQFLRDDNDVPIAVVLDIKEYEELLEDLEDLETVREYRAAKAAGEKPIPLQQALDEIERQHK